MLGEYLIGIIEVNDKRLLTSKDMLKGHVLSACEKHGLRVVGEKCHIFKAPKAFTYCFILSQSHFILHSWPEENKLAFDIFTCSLEKNAEQCVKMLSDSINGKILSIKKIQI